MLTSHESPEFLTGREHSPAFEGESAIEGITLAVEVDGKTLPELP